MIEFEIIMLATPVIIAIVAAAWHLGVLKGQVVALLQTTKDSSKDD